MVRSIGETSVNGEVFVGRWSTLLIDDASFGQLGMLGSSDIAGHANLLAERRLRPHDLYRRWERQQWSADGVSLERDYENFNKRLPRTLKRQLASTIATFIVGEYTGLDLLSPVLLGAQNEEDLIFLGTQVADESRHARVMFRVGHEVLGYDSDPSVMLRQAWEMAEQEHRDLALIEGEIMRASVADPSDYEKWLRCVTLFHLVTEGVLAVSGQRSIVRALGKTNLLPGIRSAFAAMCRDESRHISFGLHALRIGIEEGHADAIYDVLEQAMPLALTITDRLQPTSAFLSAVTEDERLATQTGVDCFLRGMRWIGADPTFTRHVAGKARPAAAAEAVAGSADGHRG
ncbi:ribonucleotide-diphosphate reductase subunit beta [Rathayibacter agropyri]